VRKIFDDQKQQGDRRGTSTPRRLDLADASYALPRRLMSQPFEWGCDLSKIRRNPIRITTISVSGLQEDAVGREIDFAAKTVA
jgi:hypothetical protein